MNFNEKRRGCVNESETRAANGNYSNDRPGLRRVTKISEENEKHKKGLGYGVK